MKEGIIRSQRLLTIEGLRPVSEPIILAELGSGHPIVAVTAAMHGNEEVGVHILDTLRKTLNPEKGSVRLIVANAPALFAGVRFLTTDLNRTFPGETGMSKERGLAPKVLEAVRDADFVIDFHSTTTPTEAFAIVNQKGKEKVEFAEMTGLSKLLLIPRQKGYAMIDFVKCGIGIELGMHNSDEAYNSGIRTIENVLQSLGMVGNNSVSRNFPEYFELTGAIPKTVTDKFEINPTLKNFQLVTKGELILRSEAETVIAKEGFYPVLIGERSYIENICLKAKKITREEIMGEKYERR